MGRINLTEDDLKQSEVTDGVHPTVLEKCEIRAQKKNPDCNNIFWQWKVDGDQDPSNDGKRIFAHTSIEKGAGGFFLNYLQGLGMTVAEFDAGFAEGSDVNETMVGQKHLVMTATKLRRDNVTGQDRPFVNATEVRKA